MNRRDFLRVSALGAAVLAVPTREDAAAAAHFDLLTVLGPERVRDIGVQYRRLVPEESDWMHRSGPIATMVRRDFETGRTVLVNGWVLSVTEARQCASFSLLA